MLLPPPPPILFPLLLFFLFSSSFNATLTNPCSSPSHHPCPPFTTSPPPYPFSTTPGCGHPSFPLTCSFPHSILSVNSLAFSLLHVLPNSSFILSPLPPSTTSTTTCSSSSIPSQPISLSSPFRFSDSSCSRLSALRPCPPPNLPNCSHCPWQCKLIKNPLRLLDDCSSPRHRSVSDQGCQSDVLEYVSNMLVNWGIEVEWIQFEILTLPAAENVNTKMVLTGSTRPTRTSLSFASIQVLGYLLPGSDRESQIGWLLWA